MSSRFVPATAALPLLSLALQRVGCTDAQRDGNPWYALERGASTHVALTLETRRRLRDRGAEWAFQNLYGS